MPPLGYIRKPHARCKNGHEYTDENTVLWSSQGRTRSGTNRICKICLEARQTKKRIKPDFNSHEAAKMRKWRADNPERNRKNYNDNRRRKKDWIDSLKVKCARCPETHPACLDFHHRDPAQKDFLLSVAVAHYSLERIQEEAAKCDILCANCHRKLHYDEKHQSEEAA